MYDFSPIKDKAVEGIIFDLGNVLVKINYLRVLYRLRDLTKMPYADIMAQFRASRLFLKYETGHISTGEFTQEFGRNFTPPVNPGDIGDIYSDIFDGPMLNENLLLSLKDRAPIFILSNTCPLHFAYLQHKYSFFRLFDEIFLSYKMGLAKPDRKIFRQTLNTIGISPEKVLFIDDSKTNVKRASQTGMQGLVFMGEKYLINSLKKLNLL